MAGHDRNNERPAGRLDPPGSEFGGVLPAAGRTVAHQRRRRLVLLRTVALLAPVLVTLELLQLTGVMRVPLLPSKGGGFRSLIVLGRAGVDTTVADNETLQARSDPTLSAEAEENFRDISTPGTRTRSTVPGRGLIGRS